MTFSMATAAPASVTVIAAMGVRTSVGAATATGADMEEAMAMATVVDMAMVTGTGAAGASDPLRRGGSHGRGHPNLRGGARSLYANGRFPHEPRCVSAQLIADEVGRSPTPTLRADRGRAEQTDQRRADLSRWDLDDLCVRHDVRACWALAATDDPERGLRLLGLSDGSISIMPIG